MRSQPDLSISRTDSASNVEAPQMPRTDDLVSDQIALSQRPSSMRTAAFAGEKSARCVEERDLPMAHHHTFCTTGGQFTHAGDLEKVFHRRRQKAEGGRQKMRLPVKVRQEKRRPLPQYQNRVALNGTDHANPASPSAFCLKPEPLSESRFFPAGRSRLPKPPRWAWHIADTFRPPVDRK